MAAITQLAPSGIPGQRYGSFAGKTQAVDIKAIEFDAEDFDLATMTAGAFDLATTTSDAFDLATTTSDSFVIT